MASKLKTQEVILQSPNGLVEKTITVGDDGKVSIGDISGNELSYLDGVTSPIQNQLSKSQYSMLSFGTNVTNVNTTLYAFGNGLKINNTSIVLANSLVIGIDYLLGTLPIQMRPTTTSVFTAYYTYGAPSNTVYLGRITINTDGTIILFPSTSLPFQAGTTYQITVGFNAVYV